MTTNSKSEDLRGLVELLGKDFEHFPDKENSCQDFHNLTKDENRSMRLELHTLGSLAHIQEQAWQDIIS